MKKSWITIKKWIDSRYLSRFTEALGKNCCLYRSSRPEVFLRKGVLKIYSKFTGEHPCRSEISRKLQSNFIKIALRHGCSPVILLHIFRTSFPVKYISGHHKVNFYDRHSNSFHRNLKGAWSVHTILDLQQNLNLLSFFAWYGRTIERNE